MLLEAATPSAPTSRSSATTRACRRRRSAGSAWSTSRGSPSSVPSCYTPVADKMEVHDRVAAARWTCAGRCSSSRWSTTRSTARSATRPASACCRSSTSTGTRSSRATTAQGPQGQGRRPRAAHRARPGALHPVHALHPRLRRGRAGPPARDGPPRRSRGADHRAGPAARQPLLAQHRRRLPGRRADREGLPLRDARLGARTRRRRSARAARPAATSRSTTRAARSTAWCRARTPRSTSTGCATRAASRTSALHDRAAGGAAVGRHRRSTGTARSTTRASALSRGARRRRPARSASCSTRSRPTRTSTRSRGWRSSTCASARRTSPAATRAGATTSWCQRRQEPEHRGRDGDRRGPAAQPAGSRRTTCKAGAVTALLVVGTRRRARRRTRARRRCRSTACRRWSRSARTGTAWPPRRTSRCRWPTWAEVDGTFTNRLGMVQRVRAAVPPAGDALPGWEILSHLARKLGATHGLRRGEGGLRRGQAEAAVHEGRGLGPADAAGAAPLRRTREADGRSTLQVRPASVSRRSTAIVKILFMVLGFVMPLASILTWVERRQSRDDAGPPRARTAPTSARSRPGASLHFVADAVKMIFKEDFVPARPTSSCSRWAPILAIAPVLIVVRDHPVRRAAVLGPADRDGRPDGVCAQPVAAADRAPRRRPALLLRDLVAGGLRRHAGRLGLAQQVGDDRRPARQLADDVVRGHDGHGGAGRVPRLRHARAGRDRRPADARSSASTTPRRAGGSSRSRSASSCSSPRRSPRPSARRSTSPRASRRSSATSSSTPGCASACSSWPSSSRSSSRAPS